MKYSAGGAVGQAPPTTSPRAFVGALGPHLPPLAAQPTTALDAALRLAAAGLPVFPSHPEGTFRKDKKTGEVIDISKTPAIGRWQFQATTDPVQVRRWWVAGGRYSGCGVSIGLRLAGLVAVDPDTPEAAEILAEHGDALGAGFAIASAKGAKMLYRRPDRLADQNGAKVKAAALGGADAVTGNVLAWTPGRVWYGELSAIGDSPAWLLEALATIYPERAEPAPLPPRPARPAGGGDVGRLVAYVLRAIIDECAKVAGLGDGRKMAMFILGVKLGALNWLAPHLERDAHQEAERACAACGLALRVGMAHFMNGWRFGLSDPRPAPALRDLGLGALAPQERATLEARAAAAVAHVGDRLRVAGVHWGRRLSVEQVAGDLVRRCLERGADTVAASCAEIGRDVGIDGATVHRAVEGLEILGFTVKPGGIADDGKVTATRWTLPKTDAWGAFGRSAMVCLDDCGSLVQHPLQSDDKPPAAVAEGILVRGLRRGSDGVAGSGLFTFKAVAALRSGQAMTAADLAEAMGCGMKAAARMGERLTALNVAEVDLHPTPGRTARAWRLAENVVAVLAGTAADILTGSVAATMTAGARVFMRAHDKLEAGRLYLARARAYAQEIGASLGAVLAVWRERDRQSREVAAGMTGRLGEVRRADAHVAAADAIARWSWAKAMSTRDLVAGLGLVTTW